MMDPVKKRLFIPAVICMILITGCAGKGNEAKDIAAIPEAGNAENGEEPDVVTFEEGQDKNKDEVPDFVIKKEDADALIMEELSGSGCSTRYRDSVRIDAGSYYTYTVMDEDGKKLDILLAVDGFSGDVKVYDPAKKDVLDFSEFPYYDKTQRKFRDISWDGIYTKGETSIELLPADDSSFEFTVYEKERTILSGTAGIENDEASWESGDRSESIVFRMTGPYDLEVTEKGTLSISGKYSRKK
ncbi:MAG: hypothetical protein J5829_00980 [Lachnospiraceae bacterium]|nr:hypothetical protein [Lachnospiraceae bacterium]